MVRRRRRGRGIPWWALLLGAGIAALSAVVGTSPAEPTAPASPFLSAAACEAQLRARPRRKRPTARIGTWNVRWFPYGAAKHGDERHRTDIDWLACAIASLEVDVLAVQEFVLDAGGRGALLDLRERLSALSSGRWRAELDDCADGAQHVGFLFDESRVQVSAPRALPALNPGRRACAGSLRPGYALHARFANGLDAHLIAMHLDSGTTARDHGNRGHSLAALSGLSRELTGVRPDPDLFVLGDFNTMGCSDCKPAVSAQQELVGLDRQLAAASLARLPLPGGAQCTHYYRGRAGLLDHIAASPRLARIARVEVHGPCRDLSCARASSSGDVQALQHLSDHCPLVVELEGGKAQP